MSGLSLTTDMVTEGLLMSLASAVLKSLLGRSDAKRVGIDFAKLLYLAARAGSSMSKAPWIKKRSDCCNSSN